MATTAADRKRKRRAALRQRRARQLARIRRPALGKFYRHELADVRPGDFEFSFTLLRGRGFPDIPLDRVVESADWADEGAAMTGSLTLHRPDPDDPKSLPVAKGHRVRCRVRWGTRRRWFTLWTMRCAAPETQLDTNTMTVELQDDLDALGRNRRDWSFRKTKRRKIGYYPHDIAREVARREGVKLGRIAKGTKRIDKLVKKDASALDVLREAYKHEHDATGRRFVIRMRDGRLEVLPYQRNRILYVFANQLTAATVSVAEKDVPTTVLEGKGHIGKGKSARKIRHTEFQRRIVDRFGYSHKEKDFGRVDSAADLRDKVRREYAKQIKATYSATLTTPGIPFVRRGEGVRWRTDEPGWHGRSENSLDRSFAFTAAVRNTVDSSGYTTEFDLRQDDPFAKDAVRREKDARARKRRQRRKRGEHS